MMKNRLIETFDINIILHLDNRTRNLVISLIREGQETKYWIYTPNSSNFNYNTKDRTYFNNELLTLKVARNDILEFNCYGPLYIYSNFSDNPYQPIASRQYRIDNEYTYLNLYSDADKYPN